MKRTLNSLVLTFFKYFQTKCNNEDKKISHINAFMPRKLIEQWEMKIPLNFFAK